MTAEVASTPLRPPFQYFGGKQRLAAKIVALLPGHDHYVEPFFGSGAVLMAKAPTKMETVNDLDGDIVNFWRVLRDRADELTRACALTPHAREEYELSEPGGADEEIERARRTWVRLTQGRSSTLRKTGWRSYHNPKASTVGMPGYLAGYVGRIAPVAERLAHVSIECRPALEIVAKYGRHSRVLLYCDPPYLGSTRGDGGSRYGNYGCEMTRESDHMELAEALRAARAAVVLSSYHSDLYDELYDHWHQAEILTATYNGGTKSPRIEVLWSNRPLAVNATLFDAVETTEATG